MYAACASIIAFRVAICVVAAVEREHITLVRRMHDYYCFWHGYSHDGGVGREHKTIVYAECASIIAFGVITLIMV